MLSDMISSSHQLRKSRNPAQDRLARYMEWEAKTSRVNTSTMAISMFIFATQNAIAIKQQTKTKKTK